MLKKIKSSCALSTAVITVCGVLLALSVFFSAVATMAHFVVFPVAGFLKVEIVDFFFIVAYRIVGIVYANLILVLTLLLRLSFDPNYVGIFTLLLCDLVFLWTYYLCDNWIRNFLFRNAMLKIIVEHFINAKNQAKPSERHHVLETKTVITSLVISVIVTSFCGVLFNDLFILKLYFLYYQIPLSQLPHWKQMLISIFLPFNLIKFSINALFFAMLYFILPSLEVKLNLKNYLVDHKMFADLPQTEVVIKKNY